MKGAFSQLKFRPIFSKKPGLLIIPSTIIIDTKTSHEHQSSIIKLFAASRPFLGGETVLCTMTPPVFRRRFCYNYCSSMVCSLIITCVVLCAYTYKYHKYPPVDIQISHLHLLRLLHPTIIMTPVIEPPATPIARRNVC